MGNVANEKLVTLADCLKQLLLWLVIAVASTALSVWYVKEISDLDGRIAGLFFAWAIVIWVLVRMIVMFSRYRKQSSYRPYFKCQIRIARNNVRKESYVISGHGAGVLNMSVKLPRLLRVHVFRVPKENFVEVVVSIKLENCENTDDRTFVLRRVSSDYDDLKQAQEWSIDASGDWKGEIIFDVDPRNQVKKISGMTFSALASKNISIELGEEGDVR